MNFSMQYLIKQFLLEKKFIFEKCYSIDPVSGLDEAYQKASEEDVKKIKTFKVLKGLKFIEFPKLGFLELNKIVKKINNLSGGILLIDYGYLNVVNRSTLQAVMKNKKMKWVTYLKTLEEQI